MAGEAAAIAQALKASGVVVRMEPREFQQLLYRIPEPLVVIAPPGTFRKKTQYLTSYKGIAFFTASPERIQMPGGAEVVSAKSIWVP
jgi:hypothetical protein